ncbi:MAG TPA: energy transducer TonB [Thermoanaerobaculia bacterium]
MSRALSRITIHILLLAAVSSLAAGQQTVQSTAAAWRSGLREVDEKLRAGKWGEAEKRARRLGSEIVAGAGTGEGAAYSLAVASAFRAIAEAGLGREGEAAWHWDMALNLFPEIGKTNVAPYGPKAAELRERILRPLDIAMSPDQLRILREGGEVEIKPVGLEVEKPRIVKQASPEYPKALSVLGAEGWVAVSTIIGVDGRPVSPRIVKIEGGGPAMAYVAMDSLAQWRFEPAKLDGQPVAVFYVLTVNFKRQG